jgi:hypothetical protein
MMRRLLLLVTVVALMVGMSVVPASAEPPIGVGTEGVPLFTCTSPYTGGAFSWFAPGLGLYRQAG